MFDLNYFNMVSEPSWSNPWLVNFIELAPLGEIMFTNVRATARIKIVIIIHFIPCRMFQHAQCIPLKLNFRSIFENIRYGLFDLLKDGGWRSSFVLAAKELISETYFRFFSFCNLVFLFCLCNCFGISSSFQLLQFGISFCNLIFLFCLCNCFGISSSLQFLQFVIWVKFLKKNKIGVIFCLLLLQNLVFRLSFNFCNLVFLFYLCNCFWYFFFSSVSAIWYLRSVSAKKK